MQLTNSDLLKTQAYINGSWVDSDTREIFTVTNPANGEIVAAVSRCGSAETSRAIEAARNASFIGETQLSRNGLACYVAGSTW